MNETMKKIGFWMSLLAGVVLAVGGCFLLTGCKSPLQKIDLGGSYFGTGVTVGFTFKGTDDDITRLARENGAAFLAGTFKLPAGVDDRVALTGNNYPGTDAELQECVTDAFRNAVGLVRIDRFDPRSIVMLTDAECTKPNIVKLTTWAISDGGTGRRVYCNSSHGAQDTDAQGRIINVMVTDEMARRGVWDETTEISPAYWHGLVRKAKAPWVILNDSCHAGGQIKAAGGAGRVYLASRAYLGPAHVQARLAGAVGRFAPDMSTIKTGCVIASCLDSQLSSETADGGAATVAFWASRKELGANTQIRDIIRMSNQKMREKGFRQNMNPVGSVNGLWSP